jgi:hypothetical protein
LEDVDEEEAGKCGRDARASTSARRSGRDPRARPRPNKAFAAAATHDVVDDDDDDSDVEAEPAEGAGTPDEETSATLARYSASSKKEDAWSKARWVVGLAKRRELRPPPLGGRSCPSSRRAPGNRHGSCRIIDLHPHRTTPFYWLNTAYGTSVRNLLRQSILVIDSYAKLGAMFFSKQEQKQEGKSKACIINQCTIVIDKKK